MDNWVPCSERPPIEKRTEGHGCCNVLVTYKYAGVLRVDKAIFSLGKFYTDGYENKTVIAWMPLPKPYKI